MDTFSSGNYWIYWLIIQKFFKLIFFKLISVNFYDSEVVLQAVFLTTVVIVGLFLYTLQSKRDFQKHYAILSALLLILFCATFAQVSFLLIKIFIFIFLAYYNVNII